MKSLNKYINEGFFSNIGANNINIVREIVKNLKKIGKKSISPERIANAINELNKIPINFGFSIHREDHVISYIKNPDGSLDWIEIGTEDDKYREEGNVNLRLMAKFIDCQFKEENKEMIIYRNNEKIIEITNV